jgi:hypothetical protein
VAVNPLDPPVRSLRPVQLPDPSGASSPSPSQASGAQPNVSAVEDAVNGAFAVLTVAAALVEYVVETTAQGRRAVLSRLPMAGYLPGLPHALAHPASAAVHALAGMADRLVPRVAHTVLARLDVPALVREYVDLDRLAALLDVEAVVARVDLDASVDRVDIARILERVDVDAIVDRADIARVLDRVDVDAVVARADLDAAVDRVDIARILDRVDIDAVVDRADVDRVIARADIAGVARYVVAVIDLPGLLRASSDSVTSDMVRSVRDQGADADRAVERIVDRLLHRAARRTGTAGGGAETRPDGGT